MILKVDVDVKIISGQSVSIKVSKSDWATLPIYISMQRQRAVVEELSHLAKKAK